MSIKNFFIITVLGTSTFGCATGSLFDEPEPVCDEVTCEKLCEASDWTFAAEGNITATWKDNGNKLIVSPCWCFPKEGDFVLVDPDAPSAPAESGGTIEPPVWAEDDGSTRPTE